MSVVVVMLGVALVACCQLALMYCVWIQKLIFANYRPYHLHTTLILLHPKNYVISTSVFFLCSSSDVLARHLRQQLQAYRKDPICIFSIMRKDLLWIFSSMKKDLSGSYSSCDVRGTPYCRL